MKSLGGCGCGGYMPEALRFLYRTLSRTKKRYILFIEQLHCSVNHNNLGNKYRPSFRHWNRMYNYTVSIEIGVKALSTAPQTTTNAPKKWFRWPRENGLFRVVALNIICARSSSRSFWRVWRSAEEHVCRALDDPPTRTWVIISRVQTASDVFWASIKYVRVERDMEKCSKDVAWTLLYKSAASSFKGGRGPKKPKSLHTYFLNALYDMRTIPF